MYMYFLHAQLNAACTGSIRPPTSRFNRALKQIHSNSDVDCVRKTAAAALHCTALSSWRWQTDADAAAKLQNTHKRAAHV